MQVTDTLDPFLDSHWILRCILYRANYHITILQFFTHRSQLQLKHSGVRLRGGWLIKELKSQFLFFFIRSRYLGLGKS